MGAHDAYASLVGKGLKYQSDCLVCLFFQGSSPRVSSQEEGVCSLSGEQSLGAREPEPSFDRGTAGTQRTLPAKDKSRITESFTSHMRHFFVRYYHFPTCTCVLILWWWDVSTAVRNYRFSEIVIWL